MWNRLAERMDLVKRWPRRRVEPLVGLREIIRELSVYSSEQDQLTTSSSFLLADTVLSSLLLPLSSPQSAADAHSPVLHSPLICWMRIPVERGNLCSRVWDPALKVGRIILIIPLLTLTDHSKKDKSFNSYFQRYWPSILQILTE